MSVVGRVALAGKGLQFSVNVACIVCILLAHKVEGKGQIWSLGASISLLTFGLVAAATLIYIVVIAVKVRIRSSKTSVHVVAFIFDLFFIGGLVASSFLLKQSLPMEFCDKRNPLRKSLADCFAMALCFYLSLINAGLFVMTAILRTLSIIKAREDDEDDEDYNESLVNHPQKYQQPLSVTEVTL